LKLRVLRAFVVKNVFSLISYSFSLQRSGVAGRWSVYYGIPTPERGNDKR